MTAGEILERLKHVPDDVKTNINDVEYCNVGGIDDGMYEEWKTSPRFSFVNGGLSIETLSIGMIKRALYSHDYVLTNVKSINIEAEEWNKEFINGEMVLYGKKRLIFEI